MKILTPFIYSLFVFPSFFLSVALIGFIEQNFGLLSFIFTGFVEGTVVVAIISALLFWIGNQVIHTFEGSKTNTLSQHLYQAGVLYAVLFFGLLELVLNYHLSRGSLGYGLVGIIMVTALVGVMTNLIYVSWARKKKL